MGKRTPLHRGEQEVSPVAPGKEKKVCVFVNMTDTDGYHEQLQRDTHFLCTDQRMDTELVDRLVLQLNRTYPQILCDKEAHRFRNLRVPTKVRLADLLKDLYRKGEEACHEFYRGLHIHAEEVYSSLPSRVRHKVAEKPIILPPTEMSDSKWTNSVEVSPERYVLNERGPIFFLSCFSFVAGIAMLYYCGEGETLRSTSPFLQCSAARLSKGAKDILLAYTEAGKHKK